MYVSLSTLHACLLVCFSIGIITVKRAKCSGCQSWTCCQRISAYTLCFVFCCHSCWLVKLLRLSSVDFSVLEHHETPLHTTKHSTLTIAASAATSSWHCGWALSSRLQHNTVIYSKAWVTTPLLYPTLHVRSALYCIFLIACVHDAFTWSIFVCWV